MGHSSFSILEEDLTEIEKLLSSLDSVYQPLVTPPALDSAVLDAWNAPDALGPRDTVRMARVYAGPWTPDIVALLPGNTSFQDASIRVMGLRLMIRQSGILMHPFWIAGGPIDIWERLLLELAIIDFFALEEAVFDGNLRGNTPSLLDEWSTDKTPHPGTGLLRASRANLSPVRIKWRDEVRNKVCAHMDLDVSASLLEVANWPSSFQISMQKWSVFAE